MLISILIILVSFGLSFTIVDILHYFFAFNIDIFKFLFLIIFSLLLLLFYKVAIYLLSNFPCLYKSDEEDSEDEKHMS